MIAAVKNCKEIVTLLIQAGADVNIKNKVSVEFTVLYLYHN